MSDKKPNSAAEQYRILKIPVNREKSVFYYYKPFNLLELSSELKDEEMKSLVDIPKERSLYLCHFVKPITEEFIQKFFGQIGRIREIHTG